MLDTFNVHIADDLEPVVLVRGKSREAMVFANTMGYYYQIVNAYSPEHYARVSHTAEDQQALSAGAQRQYAKLTTAIANLDDVLADGEAQYQAAVAERTEWISNITASHGRVEARRAELIAERDAAQARLDGADHRYQQSAKRKYDSAVWFMGYDDAINKAIAAASPGDPIVNPYATSWTMTYEQARQEQDWNARMRSRMQARHAQNKDWATKTAPSSWTNSDKRKRDRANQQLSRPGNQPVDLSRVDTLQNEVAQLNEEWAAIVEATPKAELETFFNDMREEWANNLPAIFTVD